LRHVIRPVIALFGGMYDPDAEDFLAAHADLRRIEDPVSGNGGCADLRAVHGIVVRYPNQVSSEFFESAPSLLGVVASGRGVDRIDIDGATRAGIAVANNPGYGGRSVAEHTLGLILMLTRDLNSCARDGYRTAWARRLDTRRIELSGRTLGIVGCGNVGGTLAGMARGLGMDVLAYDPYKSAAHIQAAGAAKVGDLVTLLAASDIVSLHPELNAETTGMINAAALSAMRRGAYLVNASRGTVVDTVALICALRSGYLAGAALDVYDPEPLPADSPLLSLPGVVLTPHVADMTRDARQALAASAARQVLAIVAGDRPPHLVNPQVWDRVAARRAALRLG
jgi:phosphoglycerate dehydrogenase-like enzyme